MRRVPPSLKIAWRYLIAPKSHGAVNAISIVSVVGVAVATAAIIIVLSVFNGFRHHLNTRLDSLITDISVAPAYGKVIENGDSLAEALSKIEGVAYAMPEVADNALVIASSKEMPVKLKGVSPGVFSKITAIDSLLLDGLPIEGYDERQASVSVGIAQRLGLYSAGDTLFVFAPKRHGRVNMANPAASFYSDSLQVASIFRSMQSEIDENTLITDISTARELLQYETEATSVLIKTLPGTDAGALALKISRDLGKDYVVKDRFQQQEMNFRMVAIEKWITFILLTFILIIASFNIISTLCMLVLDKENSIHTLWHLGLNRRRIGNIFGWESLLVTAIGAGAGIIIGVVVSLMQEKYGFVKLAGDPESLVISAYPVKVDFLDIGVTLIPIAIIGIVTAFISASFTRGRLN